METLVLIIIAPALLVGGFGVLFYLARPGSPRRARRVGSGPRAWQFNLWHLIAAVFVSGLMLVAFGSPGRDRKFSALLLALGILVWFARCWCNEFLFLMGLRDEDLPGRHDKIVWAFVLLAMAPIGVWVFRSFRTAYWSEPLLVRVDDSGLPDEPGEQTATQPA
jgi:hypothetical protein